MIIDNYNQSGKICNAMIVQNRWPRVTKPIVDAVNNKKPWLKHRFQSLL